MSKYTVYLRRNKVNGKCYVGQTSNFKGRESDWRCLKHRYSNQYLTSDRAEFGLENWKTEILAEADSRDEAFELEQRFIADYNSIYPNGYNISTGGYSNSGVHNKHSDEHKQKISEALKGRHHSEKTKQKISEAMKGIIPKANPPKSVYQYTLDGVLVKVWASTMESGRNGYHQGAVCACCNGKRKTYKGYRWSYVPL